MAGTKSSLLIFMVITSSVCNKTFSANYIQDAREAETLGLAISSVLQKTVNEFLIVKIIFFGEQQNFRDEIDEVMRIAQGQLVFQVIESEKIESYHSGIPGKLCPGICFLMFVSLDSYHNFIKTGDYVVIVEFASNLIIKFIRNALPHQILDLANVRPIISGQQRVETPNVFTLVNGNESFIDLFEINLFMSDNRNGTCNQLAMSIINRFSKKKLQWESELKQLKKRDDFNDCEVKYDSTQDEGIHVDRSIQQQPNRILEQKRFYGWLAELVRELTNMHNFNIFFYDRLVSKEEEEKIVKYYENMETDNDDPGQFRINSISHTNLQQRAPLIYKELYFVIPKGELYTEWEKLFLAFDLVTWCLIVMTFVAAFGTIIIINNFATQSTRDFVFGLNVSKPSLNVLAAFFGLSQAVVPRRNFARFLLMLFIIWSLIFRTCYQGLLFEYLQGDGRKPPIKSIKELLSRNLTYFIHVQHCLQLEGMEFKERQVNTS